MLVRSLVAATPRRLGGVAVVAPSLLPVLVAAPSTSPAFALPVRTFQSERCSLLSLNQHAVMGRAKNKDGNKKGGKGGKNEEEDAEEGGAESLNYEEISASMDVVCKKLAEELATLKVGKADASLLDKVFVTVSGKSHPLKAVAQVSIKDGATLSVAVFDQAQSKVVLSAIRDAGLELTPASSGNVILVPVPKPTKEFKDKLVKMAREFAEQGRHGIRNARRKAMDDLKKLKLREDDNRNAEKEVQRLHDKFVKNIDEIIKKKEQDLSK